MIRRKGERGQKTEKKGKSEKRSTRGRIMTKSDTEGGGGRDIFPPNLYGSYVLGGSVRKVRT